MANTLFEPTGLLSFDGDASRDDSPHFTPPPELEEQLGFEAQLARMGEEAEEADLQRDLAMLGSQPKTEAGVKRAISVSQSPKTQAQDTPSRQETPTLRMEIDEDGPLGGLGLTQAVGSASGSQELSQPPCAQPQREESEPATQVPTMEIDEDGPLAGFGRTSPEEQNAKAVEESVRAAAAARRRAAIAESLSQAPSPPRPEFLPPSSPPDFQDERDFVPDFDFGFPDSPQPVASSSRIDPVPDYAQQLESIIKPTSAPVRTERALDEAGRVLLPLQAATASGERITFKRRSRPSMPVDLAHAKSKGSFDLLTTPLHHLLKEVDEMRSVEKARELNRELEMEMGAVIDESESVSKMRMMWVDKYRPKKFSDLLGEDRVHREVMSWLKEWDKCVFKRQPPKKRKAADENTPIYEDALGRPRERILLLSGPPGYGKTTLAHIVAKHAGYATLEINASDDRNAGTVTSRIKNAIDAGSSLLTDKPTCVIIDEIDGASGGGDASFVRSLIKLIQDVPARKRTGTPAKPLRRPIICICNDLYTPSLRPLRPVARIARFRKPPSQFIVARLRDICHREQLKAESRVLTTLVDVTGGDIRSCLNTLQFIKSRTSEVTAEAIKNSSVGSKDTGTSLQTVWNSLLVPMGAKQRRKQIGIDNGRYVDRLAFLLQACGEHDRVVQGCFEHYPNLKPLDASFANIVKLHDWVGYYDQLSNRIGESMQFELMGYLPYAIVPWHSHFASPSNATRPTEWPKQDYEAYQTRIANEEIATSVKTTIPATLRTMFSSTTTLTELIPLLMRVITPPLRPVNAHIVKPAERAVLARLVELMIPLGFRFEQDQTEDGQNMLRLEPAIDVFVHYDGKRAGDISAGRYAVRQVISQAIDAEIARRRGRAGADATSSVQALAEQYDAAKTGLAKPAEAAAAATDFFGRLRESNAGPERSESLVTAKRFRAVYKFNEGSSSAVRKNVKMAALM